MKVFLSAIALLVLSSCSTVGPSRDPAQVHVKGHYRSNGTYIQPHTRSSPDSSKWNNYGPAKPSHNSDDSPKTRDNDKDDVPNYQDMDDDNDGVMDDDE